MSASARRRLDTLIVERGLAESRTRAQALLLAGRVRVGGGNGARSDRRAGDLVDPATPLALTEREAYVSRGGHKLAAALDAFAVDPAGWVCLDVGASTGGFTDALLQRGAARVYALDVGRGQLAGSLRADPRVVPLERVNARHLASAALPEPVDLAVVDVSFISLGLVLGPVASCLKPRARGIVALVKPQFEAGRGMAKRGVVRDPAIWREVLGRAVAAAEHAGLGCAGVIASPILGADGNREFLVDLRPGAASDPGIAARIAEVVT